MTITAGEIATLAGVFAIILALLKVIGMLKTANTVAVTNAASSVLRGEVGKEVIRQGIREHSTTCQVPVHAHAELLEAMKFAHQYQTEVAAKAHQELMEATGRIQDSTNTLSGRIENLTGIIVEVAKNRKVG